MEGFLQTLKQLNVKLFKPDTMNVEGMAENEEQENFHQERYELNDFQLLCRKCYKCYPNEHALKKHLWACTRDKIFKCQFCDKSYRFRNEIITHEMTHTGKHKYVCPRDGCERTFIYRNHLVHHVNVTHDGRKNRKPANPAEALKYNFDGTNYKCDYADCGKLYENLKSLQVHITVKHKKKRFKCKECDAEYTSGAMLKNHMAINHGLEKPFQCTECPEAFVLQSLLKKHFAGKHTEEGKRKLKQKYKELSARRKAERHAAKLDIKVRKREPSPDMITGD